MAKKERTKFITRDIMKSSIIGSFQKLDPRYMMKNPVMFVVEVGFVITLILTFFPTLFGGGAEYRVYNGIVTVILFITILFANFAESVAEGRGKAQAASLKKTKQDTKARLIMPNGEEKTVNASELKKGDIVYHRQYGDAKVKNIKADKITLDFKDGISRSFSLRVLMENNLIILIK